MSAKSTSTTTVMRMKMRSRSSAPGAGTPRRIDTKLEEFLAQQFGGPDLVDFYDSESCVQDNHDKTLLGKFKFKVLIVCRDRVYICDNPPKDLSSFIMFEDIAEIKIVDDIPKFLNGAEKENATHICLKCYRSEKSEKRRQEMTELKRRMLELKRSMIYSRAIDNKLNEIELSTPRTYKNMCSAYMENEGVDLTHRSNATLEHLAALNTNREGIDDDSAALEATNRTNKSIRFDPGLDENKEDKKIEPQKRETDAVTELAVKARYSRLVELANKNKSVSKSGDPLSLSLPLTPRSLNGYPIDTTIEGDKISEWNARELELIENRINFDFINGSQADISMVHVYVLNPKTTVIQTLRNAFFLSKILATLNYHQTFEEEIKAELLQRSVKLRNFEKKTKQLMEEIRNNQGNPERLSDLFDELMLATHTHYIIKKMFWSLPDFYKLTVNEITRFLPKSPARMDLGAVSVDRRNKELECSIAMIEAISMMLSETEFYGSRNEFLQEEKCRYLRFLFKSLVTKPEVAKLDDQFYNDQIYGLGRKAKSIMSSLIIVKGLLLWEICHFLSLSSWNNSSDFNLNICLKEFNNISFIEWYIPQLIDELAKIINDNTQVVLTPKQTIIVFKLFSLLATIIEKSNLTSSNLINFLRSNHCEEFRYYFNPDRVKLKTFNYYPIINDLIEVVRKLHSYVDET